MTQWQTTPAAIALFDAAWLATANGGDFPYDIEAQLEALADGDCVISAWDQYCAEREAENAAHHAEVAADRAWQVAA